MRPFCEMELAGIKNNDSIIQRKLQLWQSLIVSFSAHLIHSDACSFEYCEFHLCPIQTEKEHQLYLACFIVVIRGIEAWIRGWSCVRIK